MPISIGSNIGSLRAQRLLAQGSDALGRVFERLSSGQRINRSSDDAAGLSVSASLKTDAQVFTQGVRNFNDGVSLLNIADGAIEQLSEIVVRIKELAEQSANGTYSTKQRNALDKEAQALSKEFSRIQQSTTFNGLNLLNGGSDSYRLQGGYGVDGSIVTGVGNQLGSGTFGPSLTYSMNTGSTSGSSIISALGDLNGDGILDIVTGGVTNGGSDQGEVAIRLGLGDGTFGSKVTYSTETGATSGQTRGVVLGDLNGDGILDLVTSGTVNSGSNQGQASVRLGIGDGTFGSRTTYVSDVGSSGGYTMALALGDLNGDGVLDMITAGYVSSGLTTGQISVRLGAGNGTFGSRTTFQMDNIVFGQTYALAIGDLNGDGVLDVVTAGNAHNGSLQQGIASVRLGLGDGTFGSRATYATETGGTLGVSYAVTLGDINGDGALDLVTAGAVISGSQQSQASVMLGRGDGTFGSKVTYATETGSTSGTTNGALLADINGDGALDLLTIGSVNNGSAQGSGSIRLGAGNGTFGTRVSYGGGSSRVVFGDLNGDGIGDLLVSGSAIPSGQGEVGILRGVGRNGVNPLLDFSLKTKTDAKFTLELMTQKLNVLAQQRGTIGAFQSRLNVGISGLISSIENYRSASSRITDADIAQESSEMLRQQILQKSASAVLAQANQQPALSLQLLTA